MKLLMRITLVLLFFQSNLHAQCNVDNNFDQYCGSVITKGGGETFSDDCLVGWMPSHGTPQVLNFDPFPARHRPIYNVVYMWSERYDEGTRGEGILASYTFKKDHKYKVSLRYYVTLAFPGNPSDAHFELKAAQNIHRPSTWKTGNHLPSADRQQSISIVTDKNNPDWKNADFTFSADNDYNEFWIYPFTSNVNKYNLYVDYIYVCRDECTDSIYYKQGTVLSSEPRSGSIYIGSSYGGSGTVTVSATANTVVTAGTEVVIDPEFETGITSGSFIAQIDPCPGQVETRPDDDSTLDMGAGPFPVETDTSTWTQADLEDEYGPGQRQVYVPTGQEVQDSTGAAKPGTSIDGINRKSGLIVYPNPARSQVSIQFYSEAEGRIRIQMFNSVGVAVREVNGTADGKGPANVNWNVQNLPNGIYIIQVTDARGRSITRRFQKFR
ncbi:MAG TPA: T9SS type A sorting domain-containing protein [Chryseolinea sp.]|nr:T9SS type A sorting domain-containing protein [Chryseolinea sp.]